MLTQETIRDIEHNPTRFTMAKHFADACASTNPHFDRRRFMTACGF